MYTTCMALLHVHYMYGVTTSTLHVCLGDYIHIYMYAVPDYIHVWLYYMYTTRMALLHVHYMYGVTTSTLHVCLGGRTPA